MNSELYDLLGVDKEAKPAEIKAAYRRLVKIAHPDAGGDPDEFVKITMAYNTLLDPKLREAYDLSGQYGDENALQVQLRVIEHIGTMLEEIILSIDVPIESIDIIVSMREHMRVTKYKYQDEEDRLTKLLQSLHKAHKQIKRRGEGRNIFVPIVEKKIAESAKAFNIVQQQLRDVDRVVEELSRYENIVEVIRTIQAGAYASSEQRPSFFKFFTIAPT